MFGKDVQAYPKYGSEKKGLPTTYYLTIAESHIYTHSELEHVDFVLLNDINAVQLAIRWTASSTGGAIFMQSPRPTRSIWGSCPTRRSERSATRDCGCSALDMVQIARETRSKPDCRCGCRASCCWAPS